MLLTRHTTLLLLLLLLLLLSYQELFYNNSILSVMKREDFDQYVLPHVKHVVFNAKAKIPLGAEGARPDRDSLGITTEWGCLVRLLLFWHLHTPDVAQDSLTAAHAYSWRP